MCEDILSGEVDNFKTLEQNTFRFVCEIGKNIIRSILESEDNRLFKLVNKNTYESKGFKTTSIKTILGEVEYKRRYYKILDENGKFTGVWTFLLDEKLQMFEDGLYSSNMVDKILTSMIDTAAYRKAAEVITATTNLPISHEGVRDVVIACGEKIIKKEEQLVELNEQEKLVSENKEIVALFEEADGKWISLQGKDRKARIEQLKKKAEKEGKEFKKPKSIKSEIKMHVMHEGWKANDNRHSLVNKRYTVGFIPIKQIKKIRKAKIKQLYNIDKIRLKALNGDGAPWVKKLGDEDEIYQKDMLHIQQSITRYVPSGYRDGVQDFIKNKMYGCIGEYLEWVKSDSGGEEKAVKKLTTVQQYLSDGLPRYTELVGELPTLPEGLEYRTMGNAETNIFTVFTKLFTGRKSFSKHGATCLAKVAAEKIEKQTTELTDEIKAPIKIDNSVEEYINEIEKRVAELNSIKITKRSKYEYKNAEIPVNVHFLKELTKLKPASELTYI